MATTIFFSSDHAAVDLRLHLINFAQEKGYKIVDLGPDGSQSVDYPDNAKDVCEKVLSEDAIGILICGSGIGISMAANRFKGIRAALCSNTWMAKMSREHNDANILALGGRMLGSSLAEEIFEAFLSTEFTAGERHIRRRDKLDKVCY